MPASLLNLPDKPQALDIGNGNGSNCCPKSGDNDSIAAKFQNL
jgi:hypothetical protein